EVNDFRKRKAIIKTTGRNRALESAPVWIFVCCDAARAAMMFRTLRIDCRLGELTRLIHSLIDASLAAENMVTAAESVGLGSVFTIYHWKALGEVSKLLGLPVGVLPILLLCIGHPDEKPPLRPRLSTSIIHHRNRYRLPTRQVLLREYGKSNRSLVQMGYFAGGVKDLAEHWKRKFRSEEMASKEKRIRMELQRLGFLPIKL
ncbi:nitroreductase family protein, partial [Candidatus Bathyarchaeota archaeon]|nr:nitroreductase family protein [Candidatus Bathyarchaeota archaeon]